MYTWGYIKDNALAKLDLTESEANVQNFLNRFPFYANEVITQITSSIKPKHTFFSVNVENKEIAWVKLTKKYNVYTEYKEPINEPEQYIKPNKNDEDYDEQIAYIELQKAFWSEWNSKHFIGDEIEMPMDFVSFGDDVCTIYTYKKEYVSLYNCTRNNVLGYENLNDSMFETREAYDNDFRYLGYNKIICYTVGTYSISYNARWYTFTKEMDDYTEIPVPNDILDCIPSYIASQCWKIDDEYKSSVFRNEYETFLARIDDTNYKNTKTFDIKGDW